MSGPESFHPDIPSTPPSPAGDSGEKKLEIEKEKKPEQVFHLFLLQSRDYRDINDEEDIRNMNFTNMLFVEKSGIVNPNQLMPVRGSKRGQERFSEAIARESVQATHVRPVSHSLVLLNEEDNPYKYSFYHQGKGMEVHNEALFLTGKILPEPYDQPYALEEEGPEKESLNIKSYVRLSPKEVHELLEEGSVVTKDGQRHAVLDSLSPDPAAREKNKTQIDEKQRDEMAKEIERSLSFIEAAKKLDILRQISLRIFNDLEGKPIDLSDSPLKKDDSRKKIQELGKRYDNIAFSDKEAVEPFITEVNLCWASQSAYLNMDLIRQALYYSNLEAMVRKAAGVHYDTKKGRKISKFDIETGQGVPTLSLIFPLLLREEPNSLLLKKELNMSELFILGKNPQLLKLLKILRTLRKAEQEGVTDFQQIAAALEGEKLIDTRFIKDFPEMSEAIDEFFERLYKVTGVYNADPCEQIKQHPAKKDSAEKEQELDLQTLLSYAGGSADYYQSHYIKPEKKRIVRWEAQRKLILMLLLADANQAYVTRTDRGLGAIERLENDFIKEKKDHTYTLEFNPIDNEGNRSERYENVRIESRGEPKNLLDVLKKTIIRDSSAGTAIGYPYDIYARSYIFDDISEEDSALQTFSIPVNPETNDVFGVQINGKFVDSIQAPRPVAEMIASLLRKGQDNIEIYAYKQALQPGQRFNSDSPGGAGMVRFTKFLICHIDKTQEPPIERFEEVQVYTPLYGADGKMIRNASDEYKNKKEDDKRYQIQRLFTTKGLRSFIELLFPAEIYGDQIRKMYKQIIEGF